MSRAMSLKAKIRNIAKQKNIPAQVILQNYMFERLLVQHYVCHTVFRDRQEVLHHVTQYSQSVFSILIVQAGQDLISIDSGCQQCGCHAEG